jgi:hypothetical protein
MWTDFVAQIDATPPKVQSQSIRIDTWRFTAQGLALFSFNEIPLIPKDIFENHDFAECFLTRQLNEIDSL